jgi:DNA-binding GntR family transcriptional regulator
VGFENGKLRKKAARLAKGASGEFAYDALRQEIVSLSLAPGAPLDEASLIAHLGLSRTPVREALVRLAGDGLVELLPNRGARVAPMGWGEVREHLECFDLAQRTTTRWAALRRSEADLVSIERHRKTFEAAVSRRDPEAMMSSNWSFHAAIAAACGNAVFERFYLRLLTENLRIARLAMTFECFVTENAYQAHVENIVREHVLMIEAIREKDADGAEALARSHANLARKRVAETFSQGLSPAFDLRLDTPSGAS